jgi:TorA maturation chaperone TorD
MPSLHLDCCAEIPRDYAAAMPLPLEEQARADMYALIARLLLAPPDAALLASLAAADAIASEQAGYPLDRAWDRLALGARALDAQAARDEFDELFISPSIPKLNPYASLYLAGFLHEKPLARLRTDLARLGLARRSGAAETEDHLGALCESMRLMIIGAPGAARQPLAHQQAFFDTHIGSWYAACLDQLRALEGANFYLLVADLAAAFFAVEREAFEVADEFAADSME